jgi:signal transduction histidine kinase
VPRLRRLGVTPPAVFYKYVLEIPLGANARREVFLIFKESLTNVAKHAAATRVKIDFDLSHDDLKFSIADNGQGFDLETGGPVLTARRFLRK